MIFLKPDLQTCKRYKIKMYAFGFATGSPLFLHFQFLSLRGFHGSVRLWIHLSKGSSVCLTVMRFSKTTNSRDFK